MTQGPGSGWVTRFKDLGRALLLVAALGLPAFAPPASAAPRLVADALEFDLGRLRRGESASAVFTLRNAGDELLRILGADPG